MQQYIQNKCMEVDKKYNQQENFLRRTKDMDCDLINKNKLQMDKSNIIKRKVIMIIGEIIAVLSGVLVGQVLYNVGLSIVLVIVFCAVAYIVVSIVYKRINKKVATDAQNSISAREQQLLNDIQSLKAKKSIELKEFEAETNRIMNQYRVSFEQRKSVFYLTEWLLNVLSIEINKADRSKWLPQVKTSLRFRVDYNNIEIPGFGKYDMTSQGIQIDNDPMAIGALAYVLETKVLAEAQKRFSLDPSGGRAVFTSTRNDAHVEIMYNAPNGGAKAEL